VAKAHIGTIIDEAQNAQTLQGKSPSDFLLATEKAVDSDKLGGISANQFVRNDTDVSIKGKITLNDCVAINSVNGAIAGKDAVITNEKGGVQQQIRLLNANSVEKSGLLIKTSGNAGISWVNVLKVTGVEFKFMGHRVLYEGNMNSFLASPSKNGFLSKEDKSKLDTIQENAINQSTADDRYLKSTGGTLTGKVTGKGVTMVGESKFSNGAFNDPDSKATYGIKVSDGIATDLINVTGNITVGGTINEVDIVSLKKSFDSHNGSGGMAHALATTSTDGFMSKEMVTKLDGIQTSAINQNTADGRYLQLTGGTLGGSLEISSNGNHIKLAESGVQKWHVESVNGVFKVVETDVQTRLELSPTTAKLNGNEVLHKGNISSNLATVSTDGFMSKELVSKLNGITSGAEENQNAFSNIAVTGQTTLSATEKQSTVKFVAGAGARITTDGDAMTLTFESSYADDFMNKKTDNTITGDLIIDKTNPFIHLKAPINKSSEILMSEQGGRHGAKLKYDGDLNEFQLIGRLGDKDTVGLSMARAVGDNDLKYKGHTIWHAGNLDLSKLIDWSVLEQHINDASIHKDWGLWDTNNEELRVDGKCALAQDLDDNNVLKINPLSNFNRIDVNNDLNVLGNVLSSGLQVNGTGWAEITVPDIDDGVCVHFNTNATDYLFDKRINVEGGLFSSKSSDLKLQTNKFTRMTIKNSNGYVGINNENPEYRLDIIGDVRLTGNVQSSLSGLNFLCGSNTVPIKVGGLTVSNVYTDSSKQPANGIYSKGDIKTSGKVNIGEKVELVFNATENSLDFVFI